jgi:hypothetical protein
MIRFYTVCTIQLSSGWCRVVAAALIVLTGSGGGYQHQLALLMLIAATRAVRQQFIKALAESQVASLVDADCHQTLATAPMCLAARSRDS